MDNIDYQRPASVDEAVRLAQQPGTAFIGGGTNLLDLMKGGVARPLRLLDVTRLPGHAFEPPLHVWIWRKVELRLVSDMRVGIQRDVRD